jgi:hypothetical protein
MAVDDTIDGSTNASAGYVDRRMLAGSAALVTGGLLICLVGAAIGAAALVTASRRYIADRDEPPREMALRRFGQAKSATMAGVGAWQEYGRQPRPTAVR